MNRYKILINGEWIETGKCESGIGKEGVKYAIEEMSDLKVAVFNLD